MIDRDAIVSVLSSKMMIVLLGLQLIYHFVGAAPSVGEGAVPILKGECGRNQGQLVTVVA